ncbi:MAG: hypothetical protein KDK65_04385 [Chlamydiia bacterium]|nr:hypothetical protein [Chlamydiia bacterium]
MLAASKWLTLPLLIDREEMAQLMAALPSFHIFQTAGVVARGAGELSQGTFLEIYGKYIEALKRGEIPEDRSFRLPFSSVWTIDPKAVHEYPVSETEMIVKVQQPVVQLQIHQLDYSSADGKFRSKVYGPKSILWGIQFSYPQITQDEATKKVIPIDNSFPNTALYKGIQRWTRQETIPTPFIVENQLINVPARLGKQCMNWIEKHPQLVEKGIGVKR